MKPSVPNRARLACRPTFAAWVGAALEAQVERSPHGDGDVLVVDGLHLVSPLDPEAEADRLSQQIGADEEEAWAFGIGEGRTVHRLLARHGLRRLYVVGLSQRATRATLDHRDLPWLDDPRVILLAPGEVPEGAFASSRGRRVLASAELRLAEPSALRDAILLELAAPIQARWTEGLRASRARRAAGNAERFAGDGDVRSLFGTRLGAHAVVAGGGPSLVPVVSSVPRDQTLLVAVSTALAPLEKAGFVPDLVVMVHADPRLVMHLRALERLEDLAEVPLVYAADLDPDVLAAWPGPRLAAHLALPGYRETGRPRGELFCSGTVAHAAVDLAVKMGATVVRFAGIDLSYPTGATHAPGAAFAQTRTSGGIEVQSVRGEPVPTDINLLGYLRDLERYIQRHPQVRFVNGSVAGARIEGTVHEPPGKEPR